ncbi:hypothetical protein KCU83_g408, partial [Aureobasidium melanogenum]
MLHLSPSGHDHDRVGKVAGEQIIYSSQFNGQRRSRCQVQLPKLLSGEKSGGSPPKAGQKSGKSTLMMLVTRLGQKPLTW